MRNGEMDKFLLELKCSNMNHYQCEQGDAELKSRTHYNKLIEDLNGMTPRQIKSWVKAYLTSHNEERIATKEQKKEWDRHG